MIDPGIRSKIRAKLESKIQRTLESVEEYRELTKPIAPENSIGRISRMDAINNKSVNEAALRNAENKLQRLKKRLEELELEQFSTCRQCGEQIETEKLMVVPESPLCVSCTRSRA